ncbi:MAG: hypothetical protein ACOCXK_00245 [Rhodosalinus sp.]
MDGIDWIGIVIALVAGGGGVAYFAMRDLRRSRSGTGRETD